MTAGTDIMNYIRSFMCPHNALRVQRLHTILSTDDDKLKTQANDVKEANVKMHYLPNARYSIIVSESQPL